MDRDYGTPRLGVPGPSASVIPGPLVAVYPKQFVSAGKIETSWFVDSDDGERAWRVGSDSDYYRKRWWARGYRGYRGQPPQDQASAAFSYAR